MKRKGVRLLSSLAIGVFLLGLLSLELTCPQRRQAAVTIAPSSGAPAWEKGATYVGGDEVCYNGNLYRAKWWTLGEIPSTADVWENIGTVEAAPQPAPQPQTAPSAAPRTGSADGFKVVGYFPSWKPATEHLRWDVMTHVVYAFAIPTADGGLRPLENPETAQKIISLAHQNGAKALLAVGGWSYQDVPLEPTFVSATENAEKQQKFARAIVTMCDTYGFDGVDIDWEHPRVDGASGKQYEALMLDLANQLHAEGKLLTSAVLSGATPDGNVYYDAAAHSDAVLAAVDWVHVMAYDGGDGERHSPYDFAVASGRYWHETRGLDASKVVLGIPFYGRPSWASYADILSANPQAWDGDVSTINGMEAHYNGMATVRKKTQYARGQLGGVMVWEITQDTDDRAHSLMTAIAEGMQS